MIVLTQSHDNQSPYTLLDSGYGMRLERFGDIILTRPDAACTWPQRLSPEVWQQATLACTKNDRGPGFTWTHNHEHKHEWTITYHIAPQQATHLILRTNNSKNIGVFAEQEAHWRWMYNHITHAQKPVNVLNLFAYTGAASIIAAQAGAQVTHVDAAHSVITWAKKNAEHNGINTIRWIHEDCLAFIQREARRNKKYDGIILDPPAFGHDHKGSAHNGEDTLIPLLKACKSIMHEQPLFLILNVYGLRYTATNLRDLVAHIFPEQLCEYGELHLEEQQGMRSIPCNIFIRFA